MIHNFNRDGFDALYPRYRGGRPRTFTLPERQQIKRIALSDADRSRPAVRDLEPGQAGRLPGRRGGGDGHLPRRARQLLREEGVCFQAVRTWKRSNDPDFEAKKNRILELYAIADGLTEPGPRPES